MRLRTLCSIIVVKSLLIYALCAALAPVLDPMLARLH